MMQIFLKLKIEKDVKDSFNKGGREDLIVFRANLNRTAGNGVFATSRFGRLRKLVGTDEPILSEELLIVEFSVNVIVINTLHTSSGTDMRTMHIRAYKGQQHVNTPADDGIAPALVECSEWLRRQVADAVFVRFVLLVRTETMLHGAPADLRNLTLLYLRIREIRMA